MSDNWIVGNLESAFRTWNGKLAEIWSLLTTSPQDFRGGGIWTVMVNINDGLKAIGYGLLVLFFAVGIFSATANFRELQRPENALKYFIRFAAAKTAVGYCMDLMTAIFSICGGIVQNVMGHVGGLAGASVTLPGEIVTAIEEVGFLESIPLWLVSFLGSLFITVMSFILIMTVYGRFFKIYLFAALAPIPLSAFASETTSGTGKAFVKGFIGVCLEGAVIVLACLIFSVFAQSGTPGWNDTGSPVTMAWEYIAAAIFNMLILVGLVKGADRVVKEMFGL